MKACSGLYKSSTIQKLSCAAIVKQRASLETGLKLQQSTEILYVKHPLERALARAGKSPD